MKAILISGIEVSGANAQSAWWTVTGISPLAWMGLARALAIHLDGLEGSHKVSASIVHHDTAMQGEVFYGEFHPGQIIGQSLTVKNGGGSDDYAGTSMSMSLQPVALCSAKASIVIDGIRNCDEDKIRAFMDVARVAGGSVSEYKDVVVDSYDAILRKIRGGFFIKDRSDLLQGPDKLRTGLSRISRKLAKKSDEESGDDSWMSLVSLGYRKITPGKVRTTSRGQFPHSYAEPLVGLIQYIPVNSVDRDDLESIPVWSYRNPEPDIFVVSSL